MSGVIKDMQEMVDIMKQHGYPGDSYELHAPVNYARAVHAELQLRGIDVPYPQIGDEILLELQNRAKITINVH